MTGDAHDGSPPPLSGDDERLVNRLRDLLRTVDDVPEAVRAAARDVYAPSRPSKPRPGDGRRPSEA